MEKDPIELVEIGLDRQNSLELSEIKINETEKRHKSNIFIDVAPSETYAYWIPKALFNFQSLRKFANNGYGTMFFSLVMILLIFIDYSPDKFSFLNNYIYIVVMGIMLFGIVFFPFLVCIDIKVIPLVLRTFEFWYMFGHLCTFLACLMSQTYLKRPESDIEYGIKIFLRGPIFFIYSTFLLFLDTLHMVNYRSKSILVSIQIIDLLRVFFTSYNETEKVDFCLPSMQLCSDTRKSALGSALQLLFFNIKFLVIYYFKSGRFVFLKTNIKFNYRKQDALSTSGNGSEEIYEQMKYTEPLVTDVVDESAFVRKVGYMSVISNATSRKIEEVIEGSLSVGQNSTRTLRTSNDEIQYKMGKSKFRLVRSSESIPDRYGDGNSTLQMMRFAHNRKCVFESHCLLNIEWVNKFTNHWSYAFMAAVLFIIGTFIVSSSDEMRKKTRWLYNPYLLLSIIAFTSFLLFSWVATGDKRLFKMLWSRFEFYYFLGNFLVYFIFGEMLWYNTPYGSECIDLYGEDCFVTYERRIGAMCFSYPAGFIVFCYILMYDVHPRFRPMKLFFLFVMFYNVVRHLAGLKFDGSVESNTILFRKEVLVKVWFFETNALEQVDYTLAILFLYIVRYIIRTFSNSFMVLMSHMNIVLVENK